MGYQISELANLCDVNKETIRYYERKDLIPVPFRNESGYRIYDDHSIKRVKFIKRMQELGFSLDEIHKLLGVVDKDDVRCQDMYEFVALKEKEIEKKINDLARIQHLLIDLKERCPSTKDLHECPIIETLIMYEEE
ncbi:Hg(II)-responsive transcriptional regulator (plasmid) [Alkalihalobacillus hwajinpoensis]|uniref:Hg(II)-responsive transcriptional regulator n=1 Tax=Guptibacillus hwajinpoensis TaxID=208199 RepID=UPI001883213B|nr:Hg(II)-responsive transcriptional regulator [Pseudalkalibacillus hwajinpoensis]MBF0706553.1 Hg(II)-responsive transcriptional regulator [Pseudalkalibacillus hwajinpoensis]